MFEIFCKSPCKECGKINVGKTIEFAKYVSIKNVTYRTIFVEFKVT